MLNILCFEYIHCMSSLYAESYKYTPFSCGRVIVKDLEKFRICSAHLSSEISEE